MNQSEPKPDGRGFRSTQAADTWTAEHEREPHYAGRTPRQNAVALVALAGLALSLLALLVGLADVVGLSLGVTLGLRGPALAALVFGVLVWSLRSRR